MNKMVLTVGKFAISNIVIPLTLDLINKKLRK